MLLIQRSTPPKTEAELLAMCLNIEGLSFAQLANHFNILIPEAAQQRKGFIGQLLEIALGADAGTQAEPDFRDLSIELKTLPIGFSSSPIESTYITSIPLLSIHQETWLTSRCYTKLKRILWIPIEGDKSIPYGQRRVGRGFIWSPSKEEESILESDWTYLSSQISMGYLETLDASAGDYLQIRPKAADGKSLCYCFDIEGNKVQTLPRGFYLRSLFTKRILEKNKSIRSEE